MKLSNFLVIAALFTTTMLSAKDIDPNLKSRLSKEIHSIIKDQKFEELSNETVYVNFIVNTKGEIMVTSTSNKNVDDQIKSILNYKRVKLDGITPYEVYTLPVKVI